MNRISWICLVGLIGLIAIVGLLTPQRSATRLDSTPSLQSSVRLSELQAIVAGNTDFAFDLYLRAIESFADLIAARDTDERERHRDAPQQTGRQIFAPHFATCSRPRL